jgi:hypothetical protein
VHEISISLPVVTSIGARPRASRPLSRRPRLRHIFHDTAGELQSHGMVRAESGSPKKHRRVVSKVAQKATAG